MPSNYDALNGLTTDGVMDDTGGSGGRKSKKDGHKRKLSRISDSKELRKKNNWDERWTKFIQLYSNQYEYSELDGYEDIVAPNMTFSTVNVIVPSVAVHSPKITVTAKRVDQVDAAAAAEAVVNHQWRQYAVQDEVSAAVKDFVIVGHGWLKVTWDTKTETQQLTIPEWQESVKAALMERQTALSQSDLGEDEFPSVEETVQSVDREREVVTRDAPLVRRVSPFDIFVDPDATSLKDARWIAHRFLVPIEVARANTDWRQSARTKLKQTAASDVRKDIEVLQSDQEKSKDAGFAVVYEYYDLIDGTTCTMAEGLDDYLVDPVKSPFPGVHPFVFVANYDVPERFYPIGDVEVIYGLQIELALTRTAMINDRKHGRRIHLYREASLGEQGVEDLINGRDNVMLPVLEDKPFSDVYQVVAPTGLHPEWYNQSEMIQSDIDLVSGVSEYARGAMPEIRRTATEAGLIQDAANARSSDKLYKVESAMARVGERMITLTQMFMDGEDVARIVDDNLTVAWIEYTRDTIAGEFVFEVEAGSTQPQNETFRRQSALQLMDALAPALGTGQLNDAKIFEHVLRNGFGIKNAEEFIGQMPMMPPAPEVSGGNMVPPVDGAMPPMV